LLTLQGNKKHKNGITPTTLNPQPSTVVEGENTRNSTKPERTVHSAFQSIYKGGDSLPAQAKTAAYLEPNSQSMQKPIEGLLNKQKFSLYIRGL
jgi:hypothetical protein